MPTVASKANTGYLATFGFGSPIAAVSEVVTMNIPSYTVPDINCTHLLSPSTTEELIPGMLMPGKMSMTGNYIGDTSQLSIDSVAQARTIFAYQITIPVQRGAKTATITGNGFFTKNEIGPVEANRKVDFAWEIQMTGPATVSVA